MIRTCIHIKWHKTGSLSSKTRLPMKIEEDHAKFGEEESSSRTVRKKSRRRKMQQSKSIMIRNQNTANVINRLIDMELIHMKLIIRRENYCKSLYWTKMKKHLCESYTFNKVFHLRKVHPNSFVIKLTPFTEGYF